MGHWLSGPGEPAAPPDGGLLTETELDAALAWFEATPTVREAVLTGGDPLMLSPRRLGAILRRLDHDLGGDDFHVPLLDEEHERGDVIDDLILPFESALLEAGGVCLFKCHFFQFPEVSPARSHDLRDRRVHERAVSGSISGVHFGKVVSDVAFPVG